MLLPANAFSVAVIVVLLIPGTIFTGTRSKLRGFQEVDRSVSSKILHSVVVSVVLDAIYLAILSPFVEMPGDLQHWIGANAQVAALSFLTFGVAVPGLLAWLIHGSSPTLRPIRDIWHRVRPWFTNSRYESTPTAWDLAATGTPAGWVRVRIARGEWIGGRFAEYSYFSTYPEPRHLFIQEQFHVDTNGRFGEKVEGSEGVWIAIRDEYVVEWLNDGEEEQRSVRA